MKLGAMSQELFANPSLVSFVESTYVFKFPAIDAQLQVVADGQGMDLNMIKFLLCFFLTYPGALVLGLVDSKFAKIKHMISGGLGIMMMQWVFGSTWIHSFITTLLTFFICNVAPKRIIGPLAFTVILGYLVMCHTYAMYINYLRDIPYVSFPLDFTGAQMVLTMKLTSFAYNYADGYREDLFPTESRRKDMNDKIKLEENPKKKAALARLERTRQGHKKYALQPADHPGLLEFIGYIYCFPTIQVGPAFEFSHYIDIISGKRYEKPKIITKMVDQSDEHEGITVTIGKMIDSNYFVASMHRLLIGIVCMASYLYMKSLGYSTFYHYDSDWNASHTMLQRFGHMNLCLLTERLKYYFIWKLAEGSTILAGLGFMGYDQKTGESKGHRGAENMDILGFERSCNIQSLTKAWNKGTQSWLQRYSYERLGGSLFAVYTISAAWHGLYPGYFMFFLTVPLMTQIDRLAKEKLNPIIVPEYDGRNIDTYPSYFTAQVYWYVCFVGKCVGTNYATQTFSMGWYENAITSLREYNHAGHITFLVLWLILMAMPSTKSKVKKE